MKGETRGADVAATNSEAVRLAFVLAGMGDVAVAGVETHAVAAGVRAAGDVVDDVVGCVTVEVSCAAVGARQSACLVHEGFASQQRIADTVTALLQHETNVTQKYWWG